MRVDTNMYKFGDYILKKGEKLDRTMIIMTGTCNNVLEGVFTRDYPRLSGGGDNRTINFQNQVNYPRKIIISDGTWQIRKRRYFRVQNVARQ
jgi:hypothetical protein